MKTPRQIAEEIVKAEWSWPHYKGRPRGTPLATLIESAIRQAQLEVFNECIDIVNAFKTIDSIDAVEGMERFFKELAKKIEGETK